MILAAAENTPITRMVMSDVGPVVPRQALMSIATHVGKAPTFGTLAEVEQYLRTVHSGFGHLNDQQWRHLTEHSSRQEYGRWRLHYDPAIAAVFADISGDVDLRPIWQQVSCPVMVLRGADSDLLTAEAARDMAQLDNVTVREFTEVGHAPMMMSPDQIAAVGAFLTH